MKALVGVKILTGELELPGRLSSTKYGDLRFILPRGLSALRSGSKIFKLLEILKHDQTIIYCQDCYPDTMECQCD